MPPSGPSMSGRVTSPTTSTLARTSKPGHLRMALISTRSKQYVAAVDQQAERAGAASRPWRKNRRDRKRKGQEESAVAIAETSCRAAELSCCRGHRQDE